MKSYKILLSVICCFICMCSVSAGTIQDELDSENTHITLNENVTDEIIIAANQKVTIDLNGFIYTGKITVLGELTVKSSADGGKIVLDGSKNNIAVGSTDDNIAGRFVLESGKIEAPNYYAIGCFAGSTVIINGGEIDSLYSSISGNNGTGSVNFEVNGGTLTTQNGPAVYLPTPVGIKITGGTLNGGISARMGKIEITGGTINGATQNLDELNGKCGKPYCYAYDGNITLADSIYIMGGTYTSKVENTTNKLELIITGGTFNSTKGKAIAIYDMGKVAQEISVSISGNAKLNGQTGSYQVLNLLEAGVDEKIISAEYNKSELIGKVSTTITGGTYSHSVTSYLTKEYVEENVKNEYIVAKKEITVSVPTFNESDTLGIDSTKEVENILKESLEKSNVNSENTNSTVEIEITSKNENSITEEEKEDFNEYLSENSNLKINSYFDITLTVKNNITNEDLGKISETTKKLSFKIALSEELINTPEGVTRTYYILRLHDGVVEKLDATLLGNILSFESDKFSTYVLVYEDVKEDTEIETTPVNKEETKTEVIENEPVIENPKTGDSIVTYVLISLVSLTGIYLAINSLRKRAKKVS